MNYNMGAGITRSSNFEFWVRQNSPALGEKKGLYVSDPTAYEIKSLRRMMERGQIYYSDVADDRLHIRVIECFNVRDRD